jgi:hypothetical protein
MAAFLVWVDDPASDLVANLQEAYGLLGHGLRSLVVGAAHARDE